MRLMEVGVVLLAGWSKSCQKVKKSSKVEKAQKSEESQRLLVRGNIYQSTDPPSIWYRELKLLLELWQFFELFFVRPRSSLNTTFGAIIVMAKLMGLLMHYHVFPQRSQTKPFYTEFLSVQRTSSLRYFNPKDALRKMTSQPRIRADMLDDWEDVERIIKAGPTLFKSSELSWLATLLSKTQELDVKKS